MRTLGAIVSRLALAGAVVVGLAGGLHVDEVFGLTASRLFVFGDSLSDIGNIRDSSAGVVPGSSYYNGRFSNGPVWVDYLASDLGLPALQPSTAGGTNYAYGGAKASGSGGLFIRDLDGQLADYLAVQTVDPNALYVVWAGANDLFEGQTNVNVPINRVVATLESLSARGAKKFLVPNLPILGRIPNYNRDPVKAPAFDAISYQYNGAFEIAIDELAKRQPQATFYRLDVAEVFSYAVTIPATFGLTNWYDPAAPGLDPGRPFYNQNRIVPNPQQYLFWDKIHPTTRVHDILGDFAKRVLDGASGDFDADGEVDAADLALWRAGFGGAGGTLRRGDFNGDGDADGGDFLAWQRGLGVNLALPPKLATAVPEPGAAALFLLTLAAWRCATRRR